MYNYEDFEQFCHNRNIELYEGQKECAKMFFSMTKDESELHAGKSTLVAFLAGYDPDFQSRYNRVVSRRF